MKRKLMQFFVVFFFFSIFFSSQIFADTTSSAIQMKELVITVAPTSANGTDVLQNLPPGNPASTCGGKYNLSGNPAHKNFGDPNCTFTQNGLANLLKQLDPLNAFFWYNTVARNESTYYPDAWVHCKAGSPCTPDPHGAWGLFQMGSSQPPVQPPNVPGFFHHNVYDRGDVQWQIQAIKAVSENCLLYKSGTEWTYWGTAGSKYKHNVYDSSCKNLIAGY